MSESTRSAANELAELAMSLGISKEQLAAALEQEERGRRPELTAVDETVSRVEVEHDHHDPRAELGHVEGDVGRAAPVTPLLGDFVAIVRSYPATFVLALVLVFGLAMLLSLRTSPSYRAEGSVLVRPLPDIARTGADVRLNMATEAELVQSNLIASRVVAALDLNTTPASLADKLDVDVVEDTEILEVGFTAASPTQAEQRAQAFIDSYLSYRLERASQASADTREAIQSEIDTLETSLEELNARLGDATGGEASQLQSQISVINVRLVERQLELSAVSVQPEVGTTLREATASLDPVAPNHLQNGLLGLVGGLVLAVSLVLLRDRLDGRIHRAADVEAIVGAPVLVELPRRRKLPPFLRGLDFRKPPEDADEERYRSLAVEVQERLAARGSRSFLVSGSVEDAGATTVASRLAPALVELGNEVVLVSADRRTRAIDLLYAAEKRHGLSDVIAGSLDLDGVLMDTGVEGFSVLPLGWTELGDGAGLRSTSMTKIASELAETDRLVIYDVPPVIGSSDVAALLRDIPDLLLVVDGMAPARSMQTAARTAARAQADLLGVVLNRIERARMTSDA